MLTQSKVKKLFNYNAREGTLIWRKSHSNQVKIGDVAGYSNAGCYSLVRIDTKLYRLHRVVWLFVHGYIPEGSLDHIDRDVTNNKIENLREASRSCNIRNSGNRKDNVSGVKGVSFEKARGQWAVRIKTKGKYKLVVRSDDFTEAVCHRLAAEQCLNWGSCDTSSPAMKHVKELTTCL